MSEETPLCRDCGTFHSATNGCWRLPPRPEEEPALKDSFLYAHMRASLAAEPTWTVKMYGVYNDLSDETIEELQRLWGAESERKEQP